ncbi:3-hydroxyacyl-ACP dehydratase FabZ [Fodinicurvata halophila]
MTASKEADSVSVVQKKPELRFDVMEVMRMIPHRYPMLLVDRILELERNEHALGLKNATINEAFFQGHFPRQPVMPGVLIIEAMAQTAAVLVVETLEGAAAGKLVYFMSIEQARFRRPVVPGDQLHIHVSKLRNRGPVWKFQGEVRVDDQIAAEAGFSAMIREDD